MKWLIFVAASAILCAQGIDPRPAAEKYPAHAQTGDHLVGAEFHYRSFRTGTQSFFVKGYLVVEAAVFGPDSLEVSAGHFTLRINKTKSIVSQAPSLIAYQDKWAGSNKALIVGVPGGTVMVGGEPGPQFPGDQRQPPQREPPVAEQQGPKVEAGPKQYELMGQTEFPFGVRRLPVAGYIYFQYTKKLKSIKNLELLYRGPAGEATVQLK